MTPSTFDQNLVREVLIQILNAAEKIERRFQSIRAVGDLTESEEG